MTKKIPTLGGSTTTISAETTFGQDQERLTNFVRLCEILNSNIMVLEGLILMVKLTELLEVFGICLNETVDFFRRVSSNKG